MARWKTVTVEAEVDLSDISDEDLLEELEERTLGGVQRDQVEEMFYAFKLGKTERAVELARKLAQDVLGRVL
jgi:hypothetical protein